MTPPNVSHRTIGMIVPPAGNRVPPEALALYPEGPKFVARSLGLEALTIEGYSGAITRVAELSRQLREDEGADVIALMGTSLSFFRGGNFNHELIDVMQGASGVPATTMSFAIRDALRSLGARKLSVGTAYEGAVNDKLRAFLASENFEVLHLQGMGIVDVGQVQKIGPELVAELAIAADQASSGLADAVLVSCGGLPAADLAARVEPRIGKPVVASSTAGVWAAMRLLGVDAATPSLGQLGLIASGQSEAFGAHAAAKPSVTL